MLTKIQIATKRSTHSSKIGESRDGLTVVASFRQFYSSYFTIYCDKCNKEFDIPASMWNTLKNCRYCKADKRKFNRSVYDRYTKIVGVSIKYNIPLAKEWETHELFQEWWSRSGMMAAAIRMKINRDGCQLGPETVIFYKGNRKQKTN